MRNMNEYKGIKFPDPDRPPPSSIAVIHVGYSGALDDAKDKAIPNLLNEYGVRLIGVIKDDNANRFLKYTIPRKYLIHATVKLRNAGFFAQEGTGNDSAGSDFSG